MQKINDIDFAFEDTEIDVLGDAYEYLIGQFAASAGKKQENTIRLNKFQIYLLK